MILLSSRLFKVYFRMSAAQFEFGVRLYGGSERSKHLSKCILRKRKTPKIEPDPISFIMTDENFGGSV